MMGRLIIANYPSSTALPGLILNERVRLRALYLEETRFRLQLQMVTNKVSMWAPLGTSIDRIASDYVGYQVYSTRPSKTTAPKSQRLISIPR